MEKIQPPPYPREHLISPGWCFIIHPGPTPLPGDPGPMWDGSRASPSPPWCLFLPVFPSSGFPRLNTHQSFSLSGSWDLEIHRSWAGGCSHGPNNATTGWGGTQGAAPQGMGGHPSW